MAAMSDCALPLDLADLHTQPSRLCVRLDKDMLCCWSVGGREWSPVWSGGEPSSIAAIISWWNVSTFFSTTDSRAIMMIWLCHKGGWKTISATGTKPTRMQWVQLCPLFSAMMLYGYQHYWLWWVCRSYLVSRSFFSSFRTAASTSDDQGCPDLTWPGAMMASATNPPPPEFREAEQYRRQERATNEGHPIIRPKPRR